jgi:hypothetical protein
MNRSQAAIGRPFVRRFQTGHVTCFCTNTARETLAIIRNCLYGSRWDGSNAFDRLGMVYEFAKFDPVGSCIFNWLLAGKPERMRCPNH